MKNYIKIFMSMLLSFSLSLEVYSQSVALIGDAKLSLKGEGVIFSAPSVKLKGNSQIIHAEKIKLGQSEYIQILSPDALLKTRILQKGEKVIIPIGINSKADVSIVNRSAPMAFSIGMENLQVPESLPFFWKVNTLITGDQEANADLQFSWTKDAEPLDFELKSLVRKEGFDWFLEYGQEIHDTTVHLRNYTNLRAQSSAFTVSTVRLDSDGDGVPDIQEIREGTDPHDPSDYLDTDGDEVPDYIEVIQNTDPFNPISYLDSNGDGVADYVKDRSPIMFINLSDMEIPWGYGGIDAMLPSIIVAVLGSGEIVNFEVIWNKSLLDTFKRGIYQVMGDYDLYPGIFNAYKLQSDIVVTVLLKPAPEDILLDNNSFEANAGQNFIAVGNLTVLDPIDNQHEISLADLAFDNGYFQINNGTLSWNSEERADGRTEFKTLIRVQDRDGNILEKEFTIIRNRTSVNNIEIFNSFTPNGDNVNDMWGVEELRFYTGARIQVFERSGKRVFYTENPDIRWDGSFNGVELPIGTYYWTIEVRETGEVRKGMLNLLRK